MEGGSQGLRRLDDVRPCLAPGWSSVPIGLGEIAVGNPGTGRYAVLPEEEAHLLPLLDGTRSLNAIAGDLLERTGKVRHRSLFDAVGALARCSLLEPLPPDAATAFPAPRSGSLRSLGRAGFLYFMLPARLGVIPERLGRGPGSALPPALLLLLSVVGALLVLLLRPLQRPSGFSDLIWTLAGLAAAASLREVVRFGQLRHRGRAVRGIGLRLTLLLPHLGVRAPDEVMLHHAHRVTFRLWNLALPAAVGTLTLTAGLAFRYEPLQLAGIGALLALLVDLSPLWRSDLANLLDEMFGLRALRRRSVSFLLRRLWHCVLRSRVPGREERALIGSSSAMILYLFLVVCVLRNLLPAALDVLTDTVLAPEGGVAPKLIAGAVAAALALALLLAVGSILISLTALVAQISGLDRSRRGRGADTVADADSLDSLASDLSVLPPFCDLPSETVREVLARARHTAWPAKARVLIQGNAGDACYVIGTGICSVSRQSVDGSSREVARLGRGLLFGETALLLDTPREATVTTVTPATLVEIPRTLFLDLVQRSGLDPVPLLNRVRLHQFLASQRFLAGARPESLASLVRDAVPVEAKAGEMLLHPGDAGTDFFVLRAGECEVTAPDGTRVARLGPGDHFGEIALLTGRPRTAGVTCLTDCSLIRIPTATYQAVLTREFDAGLALDAEVEARLRELELA